jgi:hypothetical protein
MAIVLSNFETHSSVPGSSSTTGLPLLEPGLENIFPVVNEMMRAEGRLNRTSICESGEVGAFPWTMGRLNARRAAGVVGVEGEDDEGAIVVFVTSTAERPYLCGTLSGKWGW